MSEAIPRLLAEAVETVRALDLDVAVMGGCARNAYGEPRATRDVDLVVEVDEERYSALLEAMAARGFRPATRVGDGDEPVPDLVLFRDDAARRVDVLFAHTAFERSALSRRREGEPYTGVRVPVISIEDLIVYKLLADRPRDRADVDHVVRASKLADRPIDWEYVERWGAVWEIADRVEHARRAWDED